MNKGETNALTFYHMLSKVEIKLNPGDGFTKEGLENAKVSILGTKPVATLTLDKAKQKLDLVICLYVMGLLRPLALLPPYPLLQNWMIMPRQ